MTDTDASVGITKPAEEVKPTAAPVVAETKEEPTPNPTVPVEDRIVNEDIKTVPMDVIPVPSAVDSKVIEEAEEQAENVQQGAAPERLGAAPEVPSEVEAEKVEAAEEPSAEDASDAQLRAWARENGIEDVPGSGKLSAAWREQITAAMAAELAMDPKDEGSVEPASSKSSPTTETTSTTGDSTDQENSGSTEEETPEPAPEYRSVWQAPETWVSSQAFTA